MRGILGLFVCYGAGIVWADSRGAPLGPLSEAGASAVETRLAWQVAGLAGISLLMAGVLWWTRRSRRSHRILAFAVACATALLAGDLALSRELARARRGEQLAEAASPSRIRLVDARVATRRATPFGVEIELDQVRARPGAGPVPERLLLTYSEAGAASRRQTQSDREAFRQAASVDRRRALDRADRLLRTGVDVRIGVFIAPLRAPRNPGTPDRAHALARRGIGARARLAKPGWIVERIDARSGGSAAPGVPLDRWRRELHARIAARFDGELAGAGLARSLAVGDREGLPDATREAFRALGLSHLISVSGLHIGFVALPFAWAAAALVARRGNAVRNGAAFLAPWLLGSLAAGCYAWCTGASVPALRACLLFALFAGLRLGRLGLAPGRGLAAIALVLLVGQPARLFDAGAQLSFAACAALVGGGLWRSPPPLDSPPAPRRDPRVPDPGVIYRIRRALADATSASIAISLCLVPLVELHGFPRALPGPVANAAAIPWAGMVVLPCALFAAMLAMLLPPDIGQGLLTLLLWPAGLLESAAIAGQAALPVDGLAEGRAGRLPWNAGAVLIAAGLVAVRRGRLAHATLCWVAVGGLGLAPLQARLPVAGRPRVVFFDVGQADATLIEASDAAVLVDTGGGSEDGQGGGTLLRGLQALGVERLDALAISHGDLDHRGGARRLIRSLAIEELWLPALARADPALDALAAEAEERGIRVRRLRFGEQLGVGRQLRATILWPPEPGPGSAALRRNDASLVLRIEGVGRRLLLTGDIGAGVEHELLRTGVDLRADLLKLAHHGSQASSSAAFLAAVAARIGIASAPCASTRGLPSRAALERLAAADGTLAWTGRDGAITVAWTDRTQPLRAHGWSTARSCRPAGEGRARIERE